MADNESGTGKEGDRQMIDNSALIMLFGIFLIVIYLLSQYLKEQFSSSDGKKSRIISQIDLIFYVSAFITLIFATVIMVQSNEQTRDLLLMSWLGVVTLFDAPAIVIIVVSFIKAMLEDFKRWRND